MCPPPKSFHSAMQPNPSHLPARLPEASIWQCFQTHPIYIYACFLEASIWQHQEIHVILPVSLPEASHLAMPLKPIFRAWITAWPGPGLEGATCSRPTSSECIRRFRDVGYRFETWHPPIETLSPSFLLLLFHFFFFFFFIFLIFILLLLLFFL